MILKPCCLTVRLLGAVGDGKAELRICWRVANKIDQVIFVDLCLSTWLWRIISKP